MCDGKENKLFPLFGKNASSHVTTTLRPLSREDENAVNDAFNWDVPDDYVVGKVAGDSVQFSSFVRLRGEVWLNDELMHYYITCLCERDALLCGKNGKCRSHFFKSFFWDKYFDEGYKGVKTWSRRVPGKDIFLLDKVIVLVNKNRLHWACVVALMQHHTILYHDSLNGCGEKYSNGFLSYLQLEHKAKHNCPLDVGKWNIKKSVKTPQQGNGNDCGVFACMVADAYSLDAPLSFSQKDIPQCRLRMALTILRSSNLSHSG